MKQSRLMSFVESFVNILVGLGVAMVANAIILPLLGFEISFKQNVAIAVFMTVVSIVRSYALRRLFEALHIRRPLSPFMQAVIAERFRQIEVKGYDPSNDNALEPGALARAGAAYGLAAVDWLPTAEHPALGIWPWPEDPMRLKGRRDDLARAGALIVAEGERHDRMRSRGRAA